MKRNEPEAGHTARERAENIWYYHKWHLLILLAVLLAAFLTVRDCRKDPVPDLSVGLLVRNTLPSGTQEAVAEAVKPFLEDRNGDGTVCPEISVYLVGYGSLPSGLSEQISGVTRLAADTRSNRQPFLFLTDDPAYFQDQLGLFATNAELGLNGPLGPALVPWSSCSLLDGYSLPPGAPDLVFAFRWADPGRLNPGQLADYTVSSDLFFRIAGSSRQ